MGMLEVFDIEIYRLRNAKDNVEFLLYDIKEDRTNFYSASRIRGVLKNELKRKKVDFLSLYRETYAIPPEARIKESDAIQRIIDEELSLLDDIAFKPIAEKIFNQEGKQYFNSYREPETLNKSLYKKEEGFNFEELKEKAPDIMLLMNNLHNNDEDAIKDTLLKIADKIHYPFEKAQDCILFYPGEGAGKGIFYKHILVPIFGEYTKKILMNKLKNDFNAFLPQSLVLVLEEGKRDAELIEILKELITEGILLVNEKGKSQRMENIYFLVFLFSNHMNPADLGKRRGSYHQCNSLGVTTDQSQRIGAKLCEEIPKQLKYLLYYLHNLEFEHQDALKPFNTIAKAQVNDLNKNAIELFYDYLVQFPSLENAFADLNKRRYGGMKSDWMEINEYNNQKFISKNSFRDAYNIFCHLENLRNNIIMHNKDIVQLWALLKISATDHQRIVIRDGENAGRRLDHINLTNINKSIMEAYKNERV